MTVNLALSRSLYRLRLALGLAPRRYPDFFIAGATRAGSTYLHYALASHPDIFMPHQKELHYFNSDGKYSSNLNGYAELFHGYNGESLVGEATPLYMEAGTLYDSSGRIQFFQEDSAMERLQGHFPETRLVLSLRDPLNRMASMHEKNWRQGKVSSTLAQEIELEKKGASRLKHIYRNRYEIHLARIYDLFPRENVWLMLFEEWTADIGRHMNDLAGFLGMPALDDWYAPVREGKNEAGRYGRTKEQMPEDLLTIPEELRAELREVFQPTRDYLEELLGRELPWDTAAQR